LDPQEGDVNPCASAPTDTNPKNVPDSAPGIDVMKPTDITQELVETGAQESQEKKKKKKKGKKTMDTTNDEARKPPQCKPKHSLRHNSMRDPLCCERMGKANGLKKNPI
jgi:hypothetical protein